MKDNTQELREQILQDIYNAAVWREQVGATEGRVEREDKVRHENRLEGSSRVTELILSKVTAHTNAEIAKVLDRLDGRADFSLNADSHDKRHGVKYIPLSAIEAERNKLKEMIHG